MSVIHPQVIDWLTRVAGNGGVAPSWQTVAALSGFCYALDAASLSVLMKSVCCFVPDNLIAATTPLYKAAGADPWTNHSFVGADLTVNGLKGDGSGKYLDTGLAANVTFSNYSSIGLSCYLSAAETSADNGKIGVADTATTYQNCISFSPCNASSAAVWDTPYGASGAGRVLVAGMGSFTGYYSGNRVSLTDNRLFQANSTTAHTEIGSSTWSTSGLSLPPRNIYVFRLNYDTAPAYMTGRLSYVGFHLGMTASQSAAHYAAVQQLRVDLGGGYA